MLGLLVPILLAAGPTPSDFCIGVCVVTQKDAHSADLIVENRSAAPVSARFTLELQGAASKAGTSFDVELAPGERRGATHLESTGGPWKYDYHFHYIFGRRYAAHDDHYLYAFPFARGASHELIQGEHGGFSHQGDQSFALDFAMPEGTEVHAAREGVVIDYKDIETTGGPDASFLDRANYVYVLHADGTIGEYLHLAFHGVRVAIGAHVTRGQLIGLSGNTGQSTGPHLHFEVNHAVDATRRETVPVKFRGADGLELKPVVGGAYLGE